MVSLIRGTHIFNVQQTLIFVRNVSQTFRGASAERKHAASDCRDGRKHRRREEACRGDPHFGQRHQTKAIDGGRRCESRAKHRGYVPDESKQLCALPRICKISGTSFLLQVDSICTCYILVSGSRFEPLEPLLISLYKCWNHFQSHQIKEICKITRGIP